MKLTAAFNLFRQIGPLMEAVKSGKSLSVPGKRRAAAAATVAVVVTLVAEFFGVSLGGDTVSGLVDAAMGAIVLYGVYSQSDEIGIPPVKKWRPKLPE